MKNKIAIILIAILGFSSSFLYAQEDIIEINNTNISVPETYDFGSITEAAYSKYIIKNNRNSAVIVSDIKTPAGFFASVSEMNIASGKKIILYFGLDPKHTDFSGVFVKCITIKTNLITDIVVEVKGNIVK